MVPVRASQVVSVKAGHKSSAYSKQMLAGIVVSGMPDTSKLSCKQAAHLLAPYTRLQLPDAAVRRANECAYRRVVGLAADGVQLLPALMQRLREAGLAVAAAAVVVYRRRRGGTAALCGQK